jgi:antibiotic biosynthesis monooxygenase (ABM) superfamily enzyme
MHSWLRPNQHCRQPPRYRHDMLLQLLLLLCAVLHLAEAQLLLEECKAGCALATR